MNRITGKIDGNTPLFNAQVKDGRLVFSQRGNIRFVVDTGFNGDLFIPKQLVGQLDLELLAYNTFVLATQQVASLPVYRGHIKIGQAVLEVEMTPGDALIGMSLLQALGSQLTLNFDTRTVTLKG